MPKYCVVCATRPAEQYIADVAAMCVQCSQSYSVAIKYADHEIDAAITWAAKRARAFEKRRKHT